MMIFYYTAGFCSLLHHSISFVGFIFVAFFNVHWTCLCVATRTVCGIPATRARSISERNEDEVVSGGFGKADEG